MKALLVDDSPAMRAFVKRVLNVSGLDIDDVLEASNGREALAKLSGDPVDLVLCDINMPEMNGEQFLAALQADSTLQRPCVVVVSTDATSTRVDRMKQLGACGYLKKPFTPEELRETVDNALECNDAR